MCRQWLSVSHDTISGPVRRFSPYTCCRLGLHYTFTMSTFVLWVSDIVFASLLVKLVIVLLVLSVVISMVFCDLCPGGKWTCAPSMTCCELPSGQQGCCPYPNASCCSDHVHCCPTGWTCDSSGVGHCRQSDAKKPIDSQPLLPIDTVQALPSGGKPKTRNLVMMSTTQRAEVSCVSFGNKLECVPVVEGGGCNNNPAICDLGLSNYTGTSRRFVRAWMANSDLVGVIDICSEGSAECAERNLFCPANDKSARDQLNMPAAPLRVSKGLMRGLIASSQVKKACPGGSAQCAEGNTCCPVEGGQWGCCPMENAVCCSDKEHCCPEGYHCMEGGGGCAKNEEGTSIP